MTSPVEVQDLITLLQGVILVGAMARFAYCLIILQTSEDDAASIKKRMRNVIVFTVLAQCAAGFVHLIAAYF